MAYRKYKLSLLLRIALILCLLIILAFSLLTLNFKTNVLTSTITIAPIILIIILVINNLLNFTMKRQKSIHDFFESVKYRDFSQWFNEDSGPEDIRELHKGFNAVNQTIKDINKDKETQYLYLQKILELVDTGIIVYNIESGKVLWVNDSFNQVLNIPTIKNIRFVKKRNLKMYTDVFETTHTQGNAISIDFENNKTKILISNSSFKVKGEEFKLIVLQNIENTLNQNQSEAWNKLLRVMTHEIMNSIAPISSLAETLQTKIQLSIENPLENKIDTNDLYLGIESIRNRSDGLMKFANTYRGLNKITNLNLSKTSVHILFESISNLLKPSLSSKNIELQFTLENNKLQIEMDTSLIEQVLINLILNAVEACKNVENALIKLSAKKNIDGITIIKISDNGLGIPTEILDKVFIPFFSTKKNGSGIGLSLCQQIMFLHKGKIQINSIENSGTVIRLVF
ncbi:MAG: nitrogen fixation/metabolism regulation signal transduction histidine kinase [Polaribacter sp.]|jgi:nitrogen fixation/metabolism regulation signal transduction histidine kinase